MLDTPKRKSFSIEQKEAIRTAYLGGESPNKIIAQVGCSQSLFWLIVRGLRVKETTEIQEYRISRNAEIVKRYESGEMPTVLCNAVNVSWPRVYQILRKTGIKTLSPEEYTKKYSINKYYFNKLTSESAYWLGFILADGSISDKNVLKITLAKKDENHLVKFLSAIGSNSPIKYSSHVLTYKSGKTKTCYAATINICSKQICQDLKKWGIGPRKSCVHKTPTIAEKFLAPMYLGYFDGDGGIHNIKTRPGNCTSSIISTIVFCKDFINWAKKEVGVTLNFKNVNIKLKRNSIVKFNIKNMINMAHVVWSTLASIKLMIYFYNQCGTFLSRKKNELMILINKLKGLGIRARIPKREPELWFQVEKFLLLHSSS